MQSTGRRWRCGKVPGSCQKTPDKRLSWKFVVPKRKCYAIVASQGKQTVKEYLEEWVENHGKANLRPSTFAGYKSHIKKHILPYIGHVQLNQLTPAILDHIFQQLLTRGYLIVPSAMHSGF